MKSRGTSKQCLGLVVLASCWLVSLVSAQCTQIGPAVIKGKKFFDSASGKYIPIKGVDYYPRPNAGELSEDNGRDFFSEAHRDIWERDIEEFKALGINVVRLYAVDPGQEHSGFMCALKKAGIYVIVGLAAPCEDCAITKAEAPDCYPAALKTRGQQIINVFSKYTNVLAFSAGNEISLYAEGKPPEHNGPCQKQFLRDMRAYAKVCESSMRHIPIGVVTADIFRQKEALYYNCRSNGDELENAEWYGINVYLHCDGAATSIDQLGGYTELLEDFESYKMNIPVVLAEFGCVHSSFETINGFESQRNFLQVDAIFSESYGKEFAGAIAYEYSAEKNLVDSSTNSTWPYKDHAEENFGLGFMSPEKCDDEDVACIYKRYPNFQALADRYAAVDTSYVPSLQNYKPPSRGVTSCPADFSDIGSFTWQSAEEEDLYCPPEANEFVCPDTPAECLPKIPTAPPTQPSPTASPTITAVDFAPTTKLQSGDASVAASLCSMRPVFVSLNVVLLIYYL